MRWSDQTCNTTNHNRSTSCHQDAQQNGQCEAIAALRNGIAHVFGEHSKCNPEFCKKSTTVHTDEVTSADDEPLSAANESTPPDSFLQQLQEIIDGEREDSITAEEEEDARQGYKGSLDTLTDGLYNHLMSCCDRIWMLAPQLITNQTSNLAECYMSVRCHFDGGKYYNQIQSGKFEPW